MGNRGPRALTDAYRDVGKAAEGIDLKITVEDHAVNLFEFMSWKLPQRSQPHKGPENVRP
jgi:hypothetical protein